MGSKRTCENSGYNIKEQFPEVGKLSKRNSGAGVRIKDYKLTRYACYLIVQNSDPRKKVIALAQIYGGYKIIDNKVTNEIKKLTSTLDKEN